jgi:hypothetical protein
VKTFHFNSRYGEWRTDPGIADFSLGNPPEMPRDGIVAAIREGAVPQSEDLFRPAKRLRRARRDVINVASNRPPGAVVDRSGREYVGVHGDEFDVRLAAKHAMA